MKRLSILFLALATLVLTSCSAITAAAGSNTVAQATGQSCGTAMQGLYKSYKKTGTIDLTNSTNLQNALAVATAYTNLKQNKDNSNYRKSFTSGLIASSAGLITSANATAFVDQLLASAGLNNVNSQNIAQTASTAMTIMTLINALNK